MGKVTMQELADSLGISRVTVWKALSNRPGVSEDLRQQVLRAADAAGYAGQTGYTGQKSEEQTVSVVVSRPESSAFWMEIIHHIAKELARHQVNMMYTYMPSAYKVGYVLPATLGGDRVSGCIVLNIYDERLLGLLGALPLPKVFLDTVPTMASEALGGDLVLLEGRALVREITRRLLAGGRRRLGFIGDIAYAQTNTDRYLGFEDALREAGLSPDSALCFTGSIRLHSHYQDISQFLSRLTALPDGFVCASDFIAHFVQRYLAESGQAQAKDLVLTGFDCNDEYQNVARQITTVDVQTASLGKRLANKILFRAAYPAASYEVSYVTSNILYRGALAADQGEEAPRE